MGNDFKPFLDCGDEVCNCSVCDDNQVNGGTCSHCFTCVSGDKADSSETDCFKKQNNNI